MPAVIDTEKCTDCGKCERHCPGDIIHKGHGSKTAVLYPDECWNCGACVLECAFDAVRVEFAFLV